MGGCYGIDAVYSLITADCSSQPWQCDLFVTCDDRFINVNKIETKASSTTGTSNSVFSSLFLAAKESYRTVCNKTSAN